jgi:hypothetical protein
MPISWYMVSAFSDLKGFFLSGPNIFDGTGDREPTFVIRHNCWASCQKGSLAQLVPTPHHGVSAVSIPDAAIPFLAI